MLFSVDELNLTIIVEFIFERVAWSAAALMLFRAVRPADVAAYPLTYSLYWFCACVAEALLVELLFRC